MSYIYSKLNLNSFHLIRLSQKLQEEKRSKELVTPASDTSSKVISFSDISTSSTSSDQPVAVAMSAYQGCEYTDELVELALYEYTPWLNDVLKHPDPTSVVVRLFT